MKIAIWGAGKFGQYVCSRLRQRRDIEILYFIDKNETLQGKYIDNIEIIHPTQISDKLEIDYILVAFLGGINIYDSLNQYSKVQFGIISNSVFSNRLELKDNLLKDDNIFWIEDVEKPLLRTLETNIVDYCNLNCKGCSHFSNLYNKGEMVSFENYCSDLKKISENVNIKRFNLLGGETLLNERLTDYIEYARKVLPYTEIWVITNGLLLPRQNEMFFRCCVDNNIGIDISEYKPTSVIIDKIVELLKQYNVRYNIRDNKGDFGKNIDLEGHADVCTAMKHCRESACHFFRNGKLYKCPFAALGNKFFTHYNLDIRLECGTDIYDENLDWNKFAYDLENEPIDACKYCGEEVRFDWEVSTHPLMEEWVIN
jgi:hypothetical protein